MQAPARRSHKSVLIIRVWICQQVRESVHGVGHTLDSETNLMKRKVYVNFLGAFSCPPRGINLHNMLPREIVMSKTHSV